MPGELDSLPRGANVLVVRLRSLGDCVLTTPALTLLRAHRPDLRVGVVVEDRFAGVYEDHPAVDDILSPAWLEANKFDAALTINLHGGPRSAWLTAAAMARRRAGFGHYRFGWLYNLRIPRAQEILGEERTVHTAEHVASAMFWLGVPVTEIPRASLGAQACARDGKCAVIHPFASAADKAWPAARFLELARILKGSGFDVVVIGGPRDDVKVFAEFECWAGRPLRDLKCLMAGAALFVGNDSGPAHVAAAFGVPVVVLYGGSNPVVWAPWKTRNAVIVRPEGLANVPVREVADAAERLAA